MSFDSSNQGRASVQCGPMGQEDGASVAQAPRPKLLGAERKPPRMSERKRAVREATVAVIVELLGRWRCTQADLAAAAELSKEAISMAMRRSTHSGTL